MFISLSPVSRICPERCPEYKGPRVFDAVYSPSSFLVEERNTQPTTIISHIWREVKWWHWTRVRLYTCQCIQGAQCSMWPGFIFLKIEFGMFWWYRWKGCNTLRVLHDFFFSWAMENRKETLKLPLIKLIHVIMYKSHLKLVLEDSR